MQRLIDWIRCSLGFHDFVPPMPTLGLNFSLCRNCDKAMQVRR